MTWLGSIRQKASGWVKKIISRAIPFRSSRQWSNGYGHVIRIRWVCLRQNCSRKYRRSTQRTAQG